MNNITYGRINRDLGPFMLLLDLPLNSILNEIHLLWFLSLFILVFLLNVSACHSTDKNFYEYNTFQVYGH